MAIRLPGTTVLEELGHGTQCVVYRIERDGKHYALKVSRQDSREDPAVVAVRFRREAALLARLRHEGLPQVHEVGECDGRSYLIMELVQGPTLAAKLSETKSSVLARVQMDEPTLLKHARVLAGALAEIHSQGLVHRDIKPQNIVLTDKGIKLIDFGFAGDINTSDEAPKSAVGTFLYSAPEQTGMIERAVDGRADLYALGVVLFECATGRPPFQAGDVGELVRLHAVATPPEVESLNPAISPAFSGIVRKLLAKDPDDRHPSALELLADFAAAQGAAPARAGTLLTQEPPIVGRSRELARLRATWEAALQGNGQVVLLHGDSGAGKSRMARELLRAAGPSASVIRAKCGQGQGIALAPFRQAIEDYLRRTGDAEGARQAAGDRAGLLTRLTPALDSALGRTAAAPARDEDSQELFYAAVADFMIRLGAREGQATILLMDDIQWLDEASLHVMIELSRAVPGKPYLVIATSRSDPASAAALERFRAEIRVGTDCELLPLDAEGVTELISSHLGGFKADAVLVEQLISRTGGSPFALGEYLRAMFEAGLVRPNWGSWAFDLAGLETLKLPTDVLQLVLRRTRDLPAATLDVLSAAAAIGNAFETELLREACGLSAAAIHSAVTEASHARLIERGTEGSFAFVHDRVREAMLLRLDEASTRALHQRLAEAIDKKGGTDPRGTLSLARHYMRGERGKTPERLYRACVAAGRQALAGFAGADAYEFLSAARAAAVEHAIEKDREHDELLARAAGLTNMSDEAIECYKDAIASAEDPYRRAVLRARLMKIYVANMNTDRAREQMRRAFIELDVPCPALTLGYLASAAWDWIVAYFIRSTGIGYGTARGERRQKMEALARLYEVSTVLAYFTLQEVLNYVVLCRAMRVAARLGPSVESALAYQRYAPALARLYLHKQVKAYAAKAVQIAEQVGDPVVLAAAAGAQGSSSLFSGDDVLGEKQLLDAVSRHGRWMSPEDFLNNVGALSWTRTVRGFNARNLEFLEQHDQRLLNLGGLSESQRNHYLCWLYAGRMSTLAVLGHVPEAVEYQRKLETLSITSLYDRIQVYGDFMVLYMAQGELGEPADALIERFDLIAESLSGFFLPVFLHQRWMWRAQLRLAQAEAAPPEKRPEALEKLRKAVDEFGEILRTPVFRGHHHVLRAAILRLEGKHRKAMKRLALAEEIANEHEVPLIRYFAHRLRAHILRSQGHEAASTIEATLALTLAESFEWRPHARKLRADFPEARLGEGRHGSSSTQASRTQGTHASQALSRVHARSMTAGSPAGASTGMQSAAAGGTRAGGTGLRLAQQLESLLQVSLASSSVLNPELQARTVLDQIVRVLKAERAFLFVCHELDPGLELEFRAGRDTQGKDIAALKGYSSTVVREVRASGRPMIVSGSEQGAVLGSESAVVNDLRSIMAAPVMIRGQVAGVVYLDNRIARGMFSQDDIDILAAFSAHIGVALEVSRALSVEMEKQALHESVGRLSSLVTNVPVVLLEFDAKGFCVMAAGQGMEGMGLSKDMAGAPLLETYAGNAEMLANLKSALAGKTFSAMVEFDQRVFEIFFRPLGGEPGRPDRVVAVAIDNTERKRAEQMLVSASKMSALGEMAGGVAHEINNPLSVISIVSSQLGDMAAGGPETLNFPILQKQLAKIQATTERIAKIVKGLRTFARDARHDPKQDEKIRTIIDETVALCAERFKAHAVTLTIDPVPEELTVPCRVTEISQVLLNLCNNAYDAIKEKDEKWVRISCEASDEQVSLCVTDSGTGIPPEVVQKIFQPFFTTKAVGAGTGLGLSISKGIVDNHGGKLEYDGSTGNTRFVIVLPRRQETATSAPADMEKAS